MRTRHLFLLVDRVPQASRVGLIEHVANPTSLLPPPTGPEGCQDKLGRMIMYNKKESEKEDS